MKPNYPVYFLARGISTLLVAVPHLMTTPLLSQIYMHHCDQCIADSTQPGEVLMLRAYSYDVVFNVNYVVLLLGIHS